MRTHFAAVSSSSCASMRDRPTRCHRKRIVIENENEDIERKRRHLTTAPHCISVDSENGKH